MFAYTVKASVPSVANEDLGPLHIDRETPASLGLDQALTSRYSNALDAAEILRDQPLLIALTADIDRAKSAMDAVLVKQLQAKRKALKTTGNGNGTGNGTGNDSGVTAQQVKADLQAVLTAMQAYYTEYTDRDNFDIATAQRCGKAVKYAESVLKACSGVTTSSSGAVTR